jgi:hypothetical protein
MHHKSMRMICGMRNRAEATANMVGPTSKTSERGGLRGLGRMGKTRLSVHLARHFVDTYSPNFWFNSQNESTLKTRLVEVSGASARGAKVGEHEQLTRNISDLSILASKNRSIGVTYTVLCTYGQVSECRGGGNVSTGAARVRGGSLHHCGVPFFLTPSRARYYVVPSLLSVAKAKLRNTATPFPERRTIPHITLIPAPFQAIKQLLPLSTVFYLPLPSSI